MKYLEDIATFGYSIHYSEQIILQHVADKRYLWDAAYWIIFFTNVANVIYGFNYSFENNSKKWKLEQRDICSEQELLMKIVDCFFRENICYKKLDADISLSWINKRKLQFPLGDKLDRPYGR